MEKDKNLQLLSVGDATMDVFLYPTEAETFCTLDTRELQLCFNYGDKIPVKNLEFSVGGNAANNAVGTRRLGIRSGLVTTIGGDITGDEILKKLQDEEIDLTYTIQQENANSNYSTVISVMGERTILTYHAPRSYEFPVSLPVVEWVYITSMGETFQPFYNHFSDWVKANPQVKLAFNPGSRQLRAGVDTYRGILENTHIIYINREEAQMITGMMDTKGKERDLLKALHDMGPKIPVVTDGGGGSYAYDGNKFYHADILPVDSYERTGAGDSFGAGMLAALIKGQDIKDALMWGTVNSASVIGYIGSQKGLLHEEEIDEWLERAISSNVSVEEF